MSLFSSYCGEETGLCENLYVIHKIDYFTLKCHLLLCILLVKQCVTTCDVINYNGLNKIYLGRCDIPTATEVATNEDKKSGGELRRREWVTDELSGEPTDMYVRSCEQKQTYKI